MSNIKRRLLLLGTIKFSQQQFMSLPFLGKLAFFSKWLNPNSTLLNSNQSNQIGVYKTQIDDMTESWAYLLRKVKLDKHGTNLQNFRIKLEKQLFASLNEITDAKDKLSYAQMLNSLVSRAGFYQDGTPITTPDPQMHSRVVKYIQAERLKKLETFKQSFDRFGLKLKFALIKQLSRQRFVRSLSIMKWANKVSDQLLHIDDSFKKQQFLESLLASYEKDIHRAYIFAPKRALLHRWSLKPRETMANQPRIPNRRLFEQTGNESSSLPDSTSESRNDLASMRTRRSY